MVNHQHSYLYDKSYMIQHFSKNAYCLNVSLYCLCHLDLAMLPSLPQIGHGAAPTQEFELRLSQVSAALSSELCISHLPGI